MNLFKYKLIEPNGRVITNVINLPFEDEVSAVTYLEREGNTTLSVKKLGPITSFAIKLMQSGIQKRLTRPFLAEFLNNISMMLKSGIPIVTALEESAINSDRPNFESDISDMIITLQGGSSFSGAVEANKHIFPKSVIHLIRIGEASGTLDERIKDASDHLKRIHGIISDTKQALLYPSFVMGTMFIGLIFWLYYVVPKIVTLFTEMDVQLPALTVFIINTSGFVQSYIFELISALIISIFFITTLYKKSQFAKKRIDAVLLKTPVVGTLIQASTLAFISEYFALLMNAGIDLLQSVDIIKDSTNNAVYSDKLGEVKESLTRSETISDSFENTLIFPRFVCRMIKIGENSGTLPDQLQYVAQEYSKKLSTLVETLGKIIEPIVLIVAGTMFAIIIAGLFLPIYDLIGSIGSM
ncbi:MAG: type II secretion system F family protein [Desulfobacteraceae bacterium]|nr:type II secretion system F family protein [Desulfobacteraceae bacterium]